MAPVIHELQKQKIPFEVCITAQHREMLDQVLDFFEVKPDFDLNLMKQGQSLNGLSAEIFKNIDEVFSSSQPDLVLVHGDTTTSVIVAMAAFHKGIKVGHVEAGLRTFNRNSPFPEEINRQLTARLASIHFAPTLRAKENLLRENISEGEIFITGNTVVDALEWSEKKIEDLTFTAVSDVTGINFTGIEKFVLVTGHRRENFGEGLNQICLALKKLSDHVQIIFPVHLNPNVQQEVYGELNENKNVHLINPVSYQIMLWLIRNCEFIISDSGGIQEEAPSFGKKVLVTRENSERSEGIESEFAILVGSNSHCILKEGLQLLNSPFKTEAGNPYGDGKASKKIIYSLKMHFGLI
ncbi:UDP-N-acetylglucosamine 2-epimerase (non-hydrolyzing) [Antarcticibacterium sp. 1MA-6-2]|uniref:non-hydrolyzing UDP-N-acetylglucosamine 2-epimerase n=1 Tax=Antarcticibacterium sp. 1MA-6-2 TaxID=2908210 RepID=UPI001F1ADCE1|nr:UDP-N-acetylglucosamine 2-epimerase (non-hydrolyzing) [Antarcticibacterium sp. 1MA-6-2]UJH92511.1 UDP-N-acetylglucosamine 2-epimerase (non-hydrolyzing) [Antarcticibacterium sp. 1MA-6-2]